jgi:ferredoxin, 2Fe-2S
MYFAAIVNLFFKITNKMSETVKIIFIEKGEKKEFEVPVGTTVLEAAHNNNIDLEGACEGSLACSTCHVIVDDQFYGQLEESSEDEEDMLDLAFGLTPTSRLGCQIILTKDLDGFTVTVPDETRNISV